jgi:hypothetical protein
MGAAPVVNSPTLGASGRTAGASTDTLVDAFFRVSDLKTPLIRKAPLGAASELRGGTTIEFARG